MANYSFFIKYISFVWFVIHGLGGSAVCISQSEKIDVLEDVLSIHRQKFSWMIEKELDSLESLLDDDVVYIHSNGWQESKSDVINNIKSDHLNYIKVNIIEAYARQYGNTVIVNGKGVFDVALDEKPIEIWLNYTEVYHRKSGDKWLLVSRHANSSKRSE